jgi:glycosyltransferase involved in cell wall biosynthesis
MPLTVSILINNYNYARFLRQAIDSALTQSYPHLEVVVVDDGSTDESRQIIAAYGNKIRAVLKENGGQASAFNAGFAASRGEIVAFLDADDYYAPGAVEQIVSAWPADGRILHFRLQAVDAAGRPLESNDLIPPRLDSGDVTPLILKDGHYGVPPTSGLVYRRSLLQEILPVPEADFRICADVYLYLAAPFIGTVTAIREPLAYYRIHGANAYAAALRRRELKRDRLELAQKYLRVRNALIKKLAAEHGRPVLDSSNWEDSQQLFEHLLLSRAGSPGNPETGDGIALLLKKIWSERSTRFSMRVRMTLLTLIVWRAPLMLVRCIYPNLGF